MRKHISLLALLVLASAALAGDEWRSPTLAPHSSLESANPKYQLVGIERDELGCTAWVVADEASVHHQHAVNRIVMSVRAVIDEQGQRACKFRINFYSAVHQAPHDPSFRITEQLGSYDGEANRTFFLGDEKHYGGWALGPAALNQKS